MPEISPATLDEALQRGVQAAREYRWLSAVEMFRRAVALDPESAEARFRLGWSLWNLAEDDKPSITDMAMAVGAQALGFDQTARDRGRKFRGYRQRIDDAVYYLNSVLERDDSHARAYHYLAKCFQATDRRVEAEAAARRAAQLEPANTTYQNFAKGLDASPTPRAQKAIEEAPTTQTWDDLVLNPKTKRDLRQMQLMLEQPDLARDLGVQAPTGILLKGPPGTGKTTIARVLAHEARCNFYAITPADVNQMYVGESEKRVRDLFAKARANPPCIIFVDEIDALLPHRQGGVAIHSDKVVNQFLQEMDGLTSNSRVFIVGATNRPDMLDPAVRRGGRLSREIEIPIPDLDARIDLFRLCTRRATLAPDVQLEELARMTNGYSGADIKAAVNEAGLQALIRIADSKDSNRVLTMADFTFAIENLG
ncbi:MAG TPA: ATP-binding protein [Chthonomonadaceae bacterium]|nr:ATP-binding protein [Chthonomonadaceae bacterium]